MGRVNEERDKVAASLNNLKKTFKLYLIFNRTEWFPQFEFSGLNSYILFSSFSFL